MVAAMLVPPHSPDLVAWRPGILTPKPTITADGGAILERNLPGGGQTRCGMPMPLAPPPTGLERQRDHQDRPYDSMQCIAAIADIDCTNDEAMIRNGNTAGGEGRPRDFVIAIAKSCARGVI